MLYWNLFVITFNRWKIKPFSLTLFKVYCMQRYLHPSFSYPDIIYHSPDSNQATTLND